VDIAHAYAGVAALVMRWNPITTEVMAHANTGWGDSVQVLVHRVGGAKDAAVGWVKCDFSGCDEGIARMKNAGRYKPPDQKAGNRIGVLAHEYLQDNRDANLSAAFRHAVIQYWDEIIEDE
jgi:hypothetical protein